MIFTIHAPSSNAQRWGINVVEQVHLGLGQSLQYGIGVSWINVRIVRAGDFLEVTAIALYALRPPAMTRGRFGDRRFAPRGVKNQLVLGLSGKAIKSIAVEGWMFLAERLG